LQDSREVFTGESDPQREVESFAGRSKAWEGLREGKESSASESEAWEGLREEKESSAGRSEAWEGSQEERESSAGRSEAWEGLREGRKSFVSRSEAWKGLQRGSRASSGINKETRRKLRRGRWGKSTPVIFALPLLFWNDWNVPGWNIAKPGVP
jgi:hypothetical protein